MDRKIKIGVLGGYRGSSMINYCERADNVEIVAICDKSAEVLNCQREKLKDENITYFDNFEDFIKHGDFHRLDPNSSTAGIRNPPLSTAQSIKFLSLIQSLYVPEAQKSLDFRAQQITKSMLDAGLISLSQFDKLSNLNRKTFSPFLADIFPNTVDTSSKQR